MDVGHKLNETVCKLVKAHTRRDWSVEDATVLLKHDNGREATTLPSL